jgi:hypothetical protein
MKRIFVCSPYGGDPANQERARGYCKEVLDAGHAPFAPHLLYPQMLDDADPAQRARGLAVGLLYLAVCDEMWAYPGLEGLTSGMRTEVELAGKLNVPVVWRSPIEMVHLILQTKEDI